MMMMAGYRGVPATSVRKGNACDELLVCKAGQHTCRVHAFSSLVSLGKLIAASVSDRGSNALARVNSLFAAIGAPRFVAVIGHAC
jgi:hypothetical protein